MTAKERRSVKTIRFAILAHLRSELDKGKLPGSQIELENYLLRQGFVFTGRRYFHGRLRRMIDNGLLVAYMGGKGNGTGLRYLPADYLTNISFPRIAADFADEQGKPALAKYLRSVGSYRDATGSHRVKEK